MGRYAIPQGRIVKGWMVRLAPTPQQAARFRRDDEARRFACNWAVGQIHEAFRSGSEAGRHDSVIWSHYEMRKRWNRVKPEVAPWRVSRPVRPRRRVAVRPHPCGLPR